MPFARPKESLVRLAEWLKARWPYAGNKVESAVTEVRAVLAATAQSHLWHAIDQRCKREDSELKISIRIIEYVMSWRER